MNGSAPNFSKTGSQVLVKKKFQPNLCRGRAELWMSSYTSRTVTRKMLAPKISVIRCAISSPARSLRAKARTPPGRTGLPDAAASGCDFMVPTEVAMLLNSGNLLFLLGHHSFGKWSVGERFAVFLPICQHPTQEITNRIPLAAIVKLIGNQEPGEARSGIGTFPWRVGD